MSQREGTEWMNIDDSVALLREPLCPLWCKLLTLSFMKTRTQKFPWAFSIKGSSACAETPSVPPAKPSM